MDTCSSSSIFCNFEISKSVIQSPDIYRLRIIKFRNTSNFEVFRSKTFVTQKLNNEPLILYSLQTSLLKNCRGTQRQRLLSKFTESDHEKVERLMELHFKYLDKVQDTEERFVGAPLFTQYIFFYVYNCFTIQDRDTIAVGAIKYSKNYPLPQNEQPSSSSAA